MNAQALALMASKAYSYSYNGAWVFVSRFESARLAFDAVELPAARGASTTSSGEDTVIRFAYARY